MYKVRREVQLPPPPEEKAVYDDDSDYESEEETPMIKFRRKKGNLPGEKLLRRLQKQRTVSP